MASLASLRIGKMEFDWLGLEADHSKLFIPTDLRIGAYYYEEDQVEEKDTYTRSLRDVKGRLELLGYSLDKCKEVYLETKRVMSHGEYPSEVDSISFEQYAEALSVVDLSQLNPDFEEYGDFDFGEFVTSIAFKMDEFNKILPLRNLWKSDGGMFFSNLGPYVTLRLLLENPRNQDLDLVWCFHDAIENGHIEKNDPYRGLEASERFLIVTEGSTDSAIIKKALQILRPDIADFFVFIDMHDNYPFTGTGNLLNFIKGLKSISVQNKTIAIFDNDSEGLSKYQKALSLNLPENLKVITLPSLLEMKRFKTVGPSGNSIEDINGKAVSIEMFLDFKFIDYVEPIIRWTNYVDELGTYQGSLEQKDKFLKSFEKHHKMENYDFSKLSILLDKIYQIALSMP